MEESDFKGLKIASFILSAAVLRSFMIFSLTTSIPSAFAILNRLLRLLLSESASPIEAPIPDLAPPMIQTASSSISWNGSRRGRSRRRERRGGSLVGTLGVAGYLHMIHQMKELIMAAGKKAYVFVMGRPNPAKLANFPECDIFVYVSCAQTALLDSKEFLAPIITPFEAMLAFSRGSQWTGEYVMEFRDLISSAPIDVVNQPEEARYSFLKGGYVEDANVQESAERDDDGTLSLATATERALQLRDANSNKLGARPKSGAEFFLTRSYHGLEMDANHSLPEPFVIGRSGKASGYKDETTGA